MILDRLLKKNTQIKPPTWHHDFLPKRPMYLTNGSKSLKVFSQPYKGIWIIFWNAPTPEDIKLAQDDFDATYPKCEECNLNQFVCFCMLELEGFTA